MAQATGNDTFPRPGRVTEVCREWLVHEDGALAYRLQNEEIEQHYTGNKWRNAQVREDIPRARDEQQKEMEEAAIMHALHERMLQRQEEIDAQMAQQLAEKIEREEWAHKRAIEERDKEIAQQLQERERIRLERLREERERVQLVQGPNGPLVIPESSPEAVSPSLPFAAVMHHQHVIHHQHSSPVQRAVHYSPKGIPSHPNHVVYTEEEIAAELGSMDLGQGVRRHGNHHREDSNPEYYHTGSSAGEDEQEFSLNAPAISVEEAKRIQEEQDAELARLLQEQEGKRGGGNPAMDSLDRDRLLAVEAQDRELARMLQERERAKARRARERGKQRALLRKQQREQLEREQLEGTPVDDDDDDDDEDEPEYGTVVSNGTDNESEDHRRGTPEQRPPYGPGGSMGRADRPTDLDLSGSRGRRSSTGVKAKPRQRYPDPEAIEVLPQVGIADSPSIGSSRCTNIAMAIDPTYPRRAHPASPPSPAISSLSRGSSPAVAGICSGSASSSPGMSLPPPEFEEDDSPAPPYMPIQGQRRTSSLEKKGKKGKQKDGCKQQ